jgi:Domain of unknown function (DUF4838)
MNRIDQMLILIVCLTLTYTAASNEQVTSVVLALNGKANADIVIEADAPEPLKKIVDILADDLKLVTGADFKIVSPQEANQKVQICVGDCYPELKLLLPYNRINEDGYFIWTVGNRIHISSNNIYGEINGVAGFIKDVLNVKHYWPGELFTHYQPQPNLRFPQVQQINNPGFTVRAFGLANENAKQWCMLNRVFQKNDTRKFIPAARHNLGNIFNYNNFGKSHPEYFALRGGKRDVPSSTGYGKWDWLSLVFLAQPCFSNSGVVQETINAAQKLFEDNPEEHTFCAGINDTSKFCECDTCTRINNQNAADGVILSNRMRGSLSEKDRMLPYSNVYFDYINKVAKALKKSNPEKFVGCLAYSEVEVSPTNVQEIEDNVVICLTQDSSQYFDKKYRALDRKFIEDWRRICKHVMKYDYYGLIWYFPRIFPSIIEEDIKFSAEAGIVGYYSEVHPVWYFTGPQLYMAAQLYWDPSLDGKTILNECYRDLFGAATPDIKKFYEYYESLWRKPRKGDYFQGLLFPGQLDQYSLEEVQHAHAILLNALDNVETALEKRRVEYLIQYHKVPLLIIEAWTKTQALSAGPEIEKTLQQCSEVLMYLDELEGIHHYILQDPIMEKTMWEGFRYKAMFGYVNFHARERVRQTLQNMLPQLGLNDFELFGKSITDPSIMNEMRVRHLKHSSDSVAFNTIVKDATVEADAAKGIWRVTEINPMGEGDSALAFKQVSAQDTQHLQFTGAGEIYMETRIAVDGDATYVFLMPAETNRITLITELKLKVSWLDKDNRKLAENKGNFVETVNEPMTVRVIADAPKESTYALLSVYYYSPSDNVIMNVSPIECLIAKKQFTE